MNPAAFFRRPARISFAGRHYATLLAWGLALGFAAWVAADLFWRLAAPRATPVVPVIEGDATAAAQRIGERHLMGVAASETGGEAAGSFVLHGVATGDERHPGFAVISMNGGPAQGVVLGQEVAPGVVLAGIGADSVELAGRTGKQRLSLTPSGSEGGTGNGAPTGINGGVNAGVPGGMPAAAPEGQGNAAGNGG